MQVLYQCTKYASLRNYSLAGDVLYFPVRACGKNGSPVQSHLIDTCVTDLAPPLGAVFSPLLSLLVAGSQNFGELAT